MIKHHTFFDLSNQVTVVSGGGGILCAEMCISLASVGCLVGVLDINQQSAEETASFINQSGGRAISCQCDVLNKVSIQESLQKILNEFGKVDVLVNGAGGNRPEATTSEDNPFFDIPIEAIHRVFDINFSGTFLSCQVFGKYFTKVKKGNIINIASMNAIRPLTRIPAYSAAKAAVGNFTQWLAVHMAQEYSPEIRVNAIAPGFFLTNQNRYLLINEATDEWTPRAIQILAHTPLSRFGKPEDLTGVLLWLASSASEFVTGTLIPIDGGFSAYSGV